MKVPIRDFRRRHHEQCPWNDRCCRVYDLMGLEINEKYPLEKRDHLLFCLDCIIASSDLVELHSFTCDVGPILFSLIKNFNPIIMPSPETSVSPFLLGYSYLHTNMT